MQFRVTEMPEGKSGVEYQGKIWDVEAGSHREAAEIVLEPEARCVVDRITGDAQKSGLFGVWRSIGKRGNGGMIRERAMCHVM